MIPAGKVPEPELTVWWMGDEATQWRETLVAWLSGADSPRSALMTWRIHVVERGAMTLPRLTTHGTNLAGARSPFVVWAIPNPGVAELLHHLDQTKYTRPGYTHITAGLLSPVERMVLSEVGVVAHIQHPCGWSAHRSLFSGGSLLVEG